MIGLATEAARADPRSASSLDLPEAGYGDLDGNRVSANWEVLHALAGEATTLGFGDLAESTRAEAIVILRAIAGRGRSSCADSSLVPTLVAGSPFGDVVNRVTIGRDWARRADPPTLPEFNTVLDFCQISVAVTPPQ